jgi:hypothetical protein
MKLAIDASIAEKWYVSAPDTAKALRLRIDFHANLHELLAPETLLAECTDIRMNETAPSIDLLDDPATIEADGQAVQDFVAKGIPVSPEVRARVRARADRIREKCFARHGYINTEDLGPSPLDGE